MLNMRAHPLGDLGVRREASQYLEYSEHIEHFDHVELFGSHRSVQMVTAQWGADMGVGLHLGYLPKLEPLSKSRTR